jgi:hypothetical protein
MSSVHYSCEYAEELTGLYHGTPTMRREFLGESYELFKFFNQGP